MKPSYQKKRWNKSDKQKLKEKAWKLCSEYNRRKNADINGMVKCVTCGKEAHWKKMQAGHFLDGRSNSILFDDRGIHAQDMYCNYYGGGRGVDVKSKYYEFMLENYGHEVIDDLERKKHQIVKFSISDYQEIIEDYLDKLVGLDMKGEPC